jgi:hypothetical protein
MKNLTATLAFFMFTFSLFAQYDRAGFLLSTSLGFSKKQDFSENIFFVGSNNNNILPPEIISKSFSIASELSYVVNEKFMIGVGYFSNTTEESFSQTFNATNQTGTIVSQSSTNNFKTALSGPTLHLRYSQNILSKLIFSVKITYFNLKGLDDFEFTDSNNTTFNQKNTVNYTLGETRVSPSLHYFISEKLGCYIETVGLNLNFSDSRKPNKDIDYNFNLNPTNWRIGIFYFLPFKKSVE